MMPNHPVTVLFNHLTTPASLNYLVREGFSSEIHRACLVDPTVRAIVAWVLDTYFKSGRTVAPTKDGILATWGDEMEKVELTIDEDYETDSVEWAIGQLRAQYAATEAQNFVLRLANDVHNAAPPDKVSVIGAAAGQLYALFQELTSHHDEMPLDIGLDDAWARYQERAVARQTIQGLTFGLPLIDNHTMGIREGEMAVFGAFSGVGKSWVAIKAALSEWRRGRQTVLYTLENSVEMTNDRMAIMLAGISYEKWQRGQIDEGGLQRFHTARQQLKDTEHSPMVIMPEIGDRDPVALIRRAHSHHAESVILDQISHVERVPGSSARQRNEVVQEIMKTLYAEISGGSEKLSMLAMAQIKREGMERARRTGRHEMEDFSESSEMEKTPDFVFTGLRTPTETNEDGLLWQKLKGRRLEPKPDAWEMTWRLGVGDIRAVRELADA
jgi:replicative DNA helicase